MGVFLRILFIFHRNSTIATQKWVFSSDHYLFSTGTLQSPHKSVFFFSIICFWRVSRAEAPPPPHGAGASRAPPPPHSPQGRVRLWRKSFITNLLKTHFSITAIYRTRISPPRPFITNGKRNSRCPGKPRKASPRQFRGGRRPLRGDRGDTAAMGKHFGNLARVRHVISYSLSPFEQQAFPNAVSHGVPNVARRFASQVLRVVPREYRGGIISFYTPFVMQIWGGGAFGQVGLWGCCCVAGGRCCARCSVPSLRCPHTVNIPFSQCPRVVKSPYCSVFL